jgi:hypothetical protein
MRTLISSQYLIKSFVWSAAVYRWWGYIYWDCFIVNTVFIVVYLTCHDFLRSQKGKYLITNLWGRLKCSANVPQVLLIIWLPDSIHNETVSVYIPPSSINRSWSRSETLYSSIPHGSADREILVVMNYSRVILKHFD